MPPCCWWSRDDTQGVSGRHLPLRCRPGPGSGRRGDPLLRGRPSRRRGRQDRGRRARRGAAACAWRCRRARGPAGQADSPRLHRLSCPLCTTGHHRGIRRAAARLAESLCLPGGGAFRRPGSCEGGCRSVSRRVVAQRHHDRAGVRDGASAIGRRDLRSRTAAQHAPDCRQGADGPALPRGVTRYAGERLCRQQGADRALAREGPARLCHHAALCPDVE